MVSRVVVAVLAIAVTPFTMHAQDTTRVHPLDTLTVTAERRPVTSTATPSVVRVITADQWRAKGAGDLATVLREIPGLQLDPVVGAGAGISIEGLGSDRVQVLIDGAPVEGRLNNQFDITRLNPSQFSRIEVVEGPQSTLYGSTALGGVINLITRAPDGRHAELSTEGGTYGQFDVSGRASTLLGASGLAVSGGHRHIGIAPGISEGVPGSADRWDANVSLLQPIGTALLDVRAMHTREAQTYQESFGPGFVFGNRARNQQTDVLAALRLDGNTTELRVHASVYDHTLEQTDLASATTTSDPQAQRLADVEVIRRGSIGASNWLVGVRGEHESVTTARLIAPEENASTGALYGSAEWKLSDAISLSTGARLTVAQRWGTDLAPRLGLVWKGRRGAYLKVGLAHGFRAPSFTEQFSDFLNPEAFYAVKGNTDLRPETSWNLTGEAGMRGRRGAVYLRGFGNRLRNFIEADLVGQDGQIAQYTYLNVVKARTVGGEVGGSVTRGVLSVEASYAYLDASDESTGAPLLGRAKQMLRAAATAAHGGLALTAEVVRRSRVPIDQDPSSGAIVYQGAAPRVNVRGRIEVGQQWQLVGGVDNLGNTIPVNALAGFGRRWFAGITWGR